MDEFYLGVAGVGRNMDALLIGGGLLMLRGAVGQVGAFCMTRFAQRLRLMVAGGEAEAAVDGAADGGGAEAAVDGGMAVEAEAAAEGPDVLEGRTADATGDNARTTEAADNWLGLESDRRGLGHHPLQHHPHLDLQAP